MKQAEEANRGKVRKEIGGKLNPGKLARPALLRGFRPFCEDFGGEGSHCPFPLREGRGRTFRISTALKSAAYCFKQWQSAQLVANVSSKIHIIISFNGKYNFPSLSMGNWNIFDKSLKYFLDEWKPILKIYWEELS